MIGRSSTPTIISLPALFVTINGISNPILPHLCRLPQFESSNLPHGATQCCAGRPTVADDFRRLCRLLLVSTVGRVACRLSHTPATFPRLGTRNVIGQFLAKQRSSSALVNLCRTHNPYIM